MSHRWLERLIEWLVRVSGYAAIAVILGIFGFLLVEGAPAFGAAGGMAAFLGGVNWYPISHPPQFGILPLLLGSLAVTLGASVIAIPLGVAVAVYLAEIAPPALREALKPVIELLASIPSVVIGFVGVAVVAPAVKQAFGLQTGFTALTGAVSLAWMALPTIVSIAEDALHAVPASYKEASLALGASRWETIVHAILPAARPGIIAAAMLGIGRVVGETMAVMMLTGNAAVIPTSLLQPVRTMTATIAAEMGETVFGSAHYHALFGIGLALFLITFTINFTADAVLNRQRRAV